MTLLWQLLHVLFFGVPSPSVAGDNRKFPPARDAYPYILSVRDYLGKNGYDYFLDKDAVVVVWWDEASSSRKEAFSKSLTKLEEAEWEAYLSDFPVENLSESYVSPTADDGMKREFTFKIGATKKVVVQDVDEVELDELRLRINCLLPDEFRMSG